MNDEDKIVQIVRLHKKWADGYMLLTQSVIVVLFGGVYLLVEWSGFGATERAGAFAMLGTLILSTVIWQAVGLGLARAHMLSAGIDLGRQSGQGRPRP